MNACLAVKGGARVPQVRSLVQACDVPKAPAHAPTGSYNC